MTYEQNNDLPKGVRNNLPAHAQDIYREAFNHAWEQCRPPDKRRDPRESQEQVAHKVAWAAVEKKYIKNSEEKWIPI